MVSTKKQELETLEKIMDMVEKIGGDDSYVGTAMKGVYEIARSNIENDFGESLAENLEDAKKREAILKKDLSEAVEAWNQLKRETQAKEQAESTPDASTPSTEMLKDLENFIRNRGWEFKTEETLKAGYDRYWKCRHDVLITEGEFVIEAGENYDTETLKAVYAALSELVNQKKLRASEVYGYARFKWCLRDPKAIIAYQESCDKWIVNDCGTEVSEDEAKIAINSEWGFEASRVQIVGTPYYDATDWQFIRFDCAHMTWLWKNGNLYQVYA
ncbi:MAG: hypothetical protein ACQGTM_08645 [bacterium]